MKQIPRDRTFDSSLALRREGYDFISRRCDRLGSDIFSTRLMLRRVVCVRGAEAAKMFYGGDRFTRQGALPQTTMRLLQDKGGANSLDGAEHRQRKAMFMSFLLAPDQIERLVEAFRMEWLSALNEWERRGDITLFEEVNLVLTRAVLAWAGFPCHSTQPELLCGELSGMVENAGGFGPRAWLAVLRRGRTERFMRGIVQEVRSGNLALLESAPLRIIAEHREGGKLIDIGSAAVELLNLLRPTVAVGRFIMYAAMALEDHPNWREAFAAKEEIELEAFVEEVRRVYPFIPFVSGRARHAFEWQGHAIAKGEWILLDIFGTDHDRHRFAEPNLFSPDRGISWKTQGFDFIPHGAGDAAVTHRCPGEALTVALMMEAVRLLTQAMAYDVPPQDLSLSLSLMPARPPWGLLMSAIRRRA